MLAFLTANPDIRMEIRGHTDSVGSAEKNMELSTLRAKAVMDWLVSNGIAVWRLSSAGYGETQPIADNRTRAGQNANRRIEFIILR